MKFRFGFILFCMLTNIIFSQSNSQQDLTKYLVQEQKLLNEAAAGKNIAEYEKILTRILDKFSTLDDREKQITRPAIAAYYYNLTCLYSLAHKTDLALENLDKAIQFGFVKYSLMEKDSDLDFIRIDEHFRKMIDPLRYVGDYQLILRKGKDYNLEDKRPLPEFTYQKNGDPHLVELRKTYNLDSIAGKGSDVVQIINLMRWVHNKIQHDGTAGLPNMNHSDVRRNTFDFMKACNTLKVGLNCRGLSTVLNECYLAMGFKSRFITCLPKDSLKTDPDCHVITMVFCPSLKKWLWMDPTNNAYVMNEKGELLSIEEVRERIINNEPLILNPDANWNNLQTVTKEDYLMEYMAKNLYMFECPSSSGFNTETGEKGTIRNYIRLLPLDYHIQKPDVDMRASERPVYMTNNPKLFWALP